MERIQTLKLDFSETGSREEYLSAFCGDLNSNVVNLEVSPALKEGEILICSFLKGDEAVATLIVENNRLVIPSAVLKETGSYTAVFAVADMESRLTATATLSVTVADDVLLLAPTDYDGDSQSLISYIMSSSAIAARAAVEEDMSALTETVSNLSESLEDANNALLALDSDISLLSSETELIRDTLDGLVSSGASEKTVASGTCNLYSDDGDLACVNAVSSWVRVSNAVFVNIAFYTSGLSAFTVNGLPFKNSGFAVAVPAIHPPFTGSGVSVAGDFSFDRFELYSGSSSLKVVRQNAQECVYTATLMYFTSDPMPE